jgi:TolA-binding protein
LRCCDELQAEWQVQALLQSGGYLAKPGRIEAVRAVAKLVGQGKDQKQAAETLSALVVKLKKDKDAAAEGGSQDAAQLVDRVLEAKGREETDRQAIRQLLEAAKYVTDDQKNLAQAVRKLIAEDKKLRDGLASATQLLTSEKYLTEANADIAGAVEKLSQDKKTTETKLKAAVAQLQAVENNVQEMEKRLTDVKGVTSEERPDQGARGVDLPGGTNPYVADDHYGAGIGLYWSGRYHDAEKEFALAIRYAGAYDQDARHFYYLGLSQFQEGNARAAAESIRRAVLLEQQNKPGSATINKILERVQGEPRRFLNTYRP